MTKIETHTVIDRPLADVFTYATDWRTIPLYMDYVLEARPLADESAGERMPLFVRVKVLGRTMETEWKTLEFVEGEKWRVLAPLMGTNAEKTWRFYPQVEKTDATRVEFSIEYRPAPAFIGPLMDMILLRTYFRRLYERAMRNLKRRLEAQAAGKEAAATL
jgi:uncharacterized membrane protein